MRRRQRGTGGPGGATWSLWPDADPGGTLQTDGGANIYTATEMRSMMAGTITHVRVRGFGTGNVDGAVWLLDTPTAALAAATVTATVASGEQGVWETLELASPVHVDAGAPWVVGIRHSAGRYWETTNGFVAQVATGPLLAPADASVNSYPGGSSNARNGRFALAVGTPGGTLPIDTASNKYYVDVVFVED